MLDKLAKNIVVFFSTVILLTCTIISMFFIATVKNFDENVMIKLTTSVGLICYLAIDFIIVFGIKKLEDKVKISKKIKKAVLIIAICIYAGVSVYWVRTSNIPPVDDSKSVNNLAISFVNRRY
ncbi:MAG: hypothetical protein V8R39_03810 [Clostridia bacterium]|jgi:amino acid transporter